MTHPVLNEVGTIIGSYNADWILCVSGHFDSEGNEAVDKIVRKGTERPPYRKELIWKRADDSRLWCSPQNNARVFSNWPPNANIYCSLWNVTQFTKNFYHMTWCSYSWLTLLNVKNHKFAYGRYENRDLWKSLLLWCQWNRHLNCSPASDPPGAQDEKVVAPCTVSPVTHIRLPSGHANKEEC